MAPQFSDTYVRIALLNVKYREGRKHGTSYWGEICRARVCAWKAVRRRRSYKGQGCVGIHQQNIVYAEFKPCPITVVCLFQLVRCCGSRKLSSFPRAPVQLLRVGCRESTLCVHCVCIALACVIWGVCVGVGFNEQISSSILQGLPVWCYVRKFPSMQQSSAVNGSGGL
jgi:hypothetical protein